MLELIILQASIILLVTVVFIMIRNHFRKAQVHKRVIHQIKEENKIWGEILKQKDINKA